MRALTTRAATSPSIARYLDTVDCLHHYALRVASEQTTSDPTTLVRVVDGIVREVADESIRTAAQAAVGRLRAAALLWGTDDRLHVVTAVRDQVATAPAPTWPAPECHRSESTASRESMAGGESTAGGDGQQGAFDANTRGGSVAHELIETIAEIADLWALSPGPVLRSGGLSSRALETLATHLNRSRQEVTVCLDLGWAAGLLAQGSTGSDIGWMPTAAFEAWIGESAARRWAKIARSWRDRSIVTGERPLIASEHAFTRTWRMHLLEVLADAPGACDLATAIAVVDYRWPRRRGAKRTEVLQATWVEAERLGILIDGVLTDAGRALAANAANAALASAIESTLTPEVDHVHIQADHTMVAPGPLNPTVGRRLRMITDVESRGHATVFRLTNSSLKRALSVDPDPESWQRFLSEIGSKKLPQPVEYLITDAARKVPARATLHTAPAEPTPVRNAPVEASPTRIEKALDILRARDARQIPQIVAELSDSDVPTMEGAAVVAALRYSIDHHETVRISHAESDGSTALLLVDPIRLGGGSLTAYDHHEEQVRTFAISRISGVATVRISA
jgi:hypothetical protein